MTSPEFARGVLCTHDRYDTLEAVQGSAFDDHDTLYVRCDGCRGLYVVTQWKTRGEDWSPMPAQDIKRFGVTPLSTWPICSCDGPMYPGEELGYFSCGNEACPHCGEDVTRADLEAREEADVLRMFMRDRGDSDTERDAMREAGRIR